MANICKGSGSESIWMLLVTICITSNNILKLNITILNIKIHNSGNNFTGQKKLIIISEKRVHYNNNNNLQVLLHHTLPLLARTQQHSALTQTSLRRVFFFCACDHQNERSLVGSLHNWFPPESHNDRVSLFVAHRWRLAHATADNQPSCIQLCSLRLLPPSQFDNSNKKADGRSETELRHAQANLTF